MANKQTSGFNTLAGISTLQINFQSVVTNNGIIVTFPAMLTSFKDSFTSSWESQEVYGRMDPIGIFKGTKRITTFSLDVPSESLEDAKANFNKINTLITWLYPVYEYNGKGARVMVASPLMKIRFANYIKNAAGDQAGYLVGYVNGFDFNPDFEHGTHIVKNVGLIPTFFKLDVTFNVLHTHWLGGIIVDMSNDKIKSQLTKDFSTNNEGNWKTQLENQVKETRKDTFLKSSNFPYRTK